MTRRTPGDTPAAGLTQRLCSLIADLPHSHVGRLTRSSGETVRRCVAGQMPSLLFIAYLCEELEVSLDWLVFGRGPRDRREAARAVLREATAEELRAALHAIEQSPAPSEPDNSVAAVADGAIPSPVSEAKPVRWPGHAEVKSRRIHLMLGPADGWVINVEPDPPEELELWIDSRTGAPRRWPTGDWSVGSVRPVVYRRVMGNVYRWAEPDMHDGRERRPAEPSPA